MPATEPPSQRVGPAGGTEARPMVWTPGGFVPPEPSPTPPTAAPPPGSLGSRHDAPAGAVPDEIAHVEAVARRVESWTGVRLPPVGIDRSASAARRAEALGAAAFTDDAGVHLPSAIGPLDDPSARALLAHELTHVAQRQRLGGSPLPPEHSPLGVRLEAEARSAERRERSSARLVGTQVTPAQTGPSRGFTVLGHDGGSTGLLASSAAPEPTTSVPTMVESMPSPQVDAAANPPELAHVARSAERPASTPTSNARASTLLAYPATSAPWPAGAATAVLPSPRLRWTPGSHAQPAWTTPPPPVPPVSPPPPPPPQPPASSASSSPGERAPQRAPLAPATASFRSPWDEPPSAKQLDQLARRLLPTLTAAIRAELAGDRDRIGALTNNYQRW